MHHAKQYRPNFNTAPSSPKRRRMRALRSNRPSSVWERCTAPAGSRTASPSSSSRFLPTLHHPLHRHTLLHRTARGAELCGVRAGRSVQERQLRRVRPRGRVHQLRLHGRLRPRARRQPLRQLAPQIRPQVRRLTPQRGCCPPSAFGPARLPVVDGGRAAAWQPGARAHSSLSFSPPLPAHPTRPRPPD
jgi:hypothetical protein